MEVLKVYIFIFILLVRTGTFNLVLGSDYVDCKFDNGLCNWKQSNDDDFNWTRTSGKTSTGKTGPDFDHTSGDGFYVYIDSSKANKKNTAVLTSQYIDPAHYCLSFWYYMYGEHVNRLRFLKRERDNNPKEERIIRRNQGPRWILEVLELNSTSDFQIMFEARVRNNDAHDLGDIAIDDIMMFSARRCPTDCGDPTPEFGNSDSQNMTIGTQVNITCHPGYKLLGNSSIVCLHNGNWSESPTCLPIDCPPMPDRMIVDYSNGTKYNDIAVLSCKESYRLIGNTTIRCRANGNWTVFPTCAIDESENSALIAVYVAVPLVVIGLASLLVVFLLRKRHVLAPRRHKTQQKADGPPTVQFPNKTYNEYALNGMNSSKKPNHFDTLQPQDDEYAIISDGRQEEQSKTAYHNVLSVGNSLKQATEHLYDHTKITSEKTLDNTYSHISGNKADTMFDSGYSSTSNVSRFAYANNAEDSYDLLKNNTHIETLQHGSHIKPDMKTDLEYDHAELGGSNAKSHEQDEYSHINETNIRRGNTEELVNYKEGQYEYASETVPNAETSRNNRKADYESPVGHTPQYLTVEREIEEDDRHYFVLEPEEKGRESQVPVNHDYFVLEKIETV